MISEDGRDLIADAVEQRKIELEREILTAPYERYAEIAKDIECCRNLLVRLEQSSCRPAAGTVIH
jgi:hypothetical protein